MELLIAFASLGLIAIALTFVVIGVVRRDGRDRARLVEANAALIAAGAARDQELRACRDAAEALEQTIADRAATVAKLTEALDGANARLSDEVARATAELRAELGRLADSLAAREGEIARREDERAEIRQRLRAAIGIAHDAVQRLDAFRDAYATVRAAHKDRTDRALEGILAAVRTRSALEERIGQLESEEAAEARPEGIPSARWLSAVFEAFGLADRARFRPLGAASAEGPDAELTLPGGTVLAVDVSAAQPDPNATAERTDLRLALLASRAYWRDRPRDNAGVAAIVPDATRARLAAAGGTVLAAGLHSAGVRLRSMAEFVVFAAAIARRYELEALAGRTQYDAGLDRPADAHLRLGLDALAALKDALHRAAGLFGDDRDPIADAPPEPPPPRDGPARFDPPAFLIAPRRPPGGPRAPEADKDEDKGKDAAG